MITGMLQQEGWRVTHKRVERIWRQEGLKVPQKQPKKKRLRLNNGSCVRLRARHKDHVWSYDFVAERTEDGRPLRLLNIIDEYTRECLSIRVARSIKAEDVLDELSNLFITRGIPEHIRSDNGGRVYRKSSAQMASGVGRKDLVHRTGESVGEWLY